MTTATTTSVLLLFHQPKNMQKKERKLFLVDPHPTASVDLSYVIIQRDTMRITYLIHGKPTDAAAAWLIFYVHTLSSRGHHDIDAYSLNVKKGELESAHGRQ